MKNVLFDLDGTIADTERNKGKILKECSDLLGLPPIHRNEYLMAHTKVLRKGRVDTRYGIFRRILEDKGVKDPDEKAEDLEREYRSKTLKELRVLDDAYSVLNELSDGFICLITNGPRIIQREKVENLNLNNYFDAIVISGEVGVCKPNPKIFWHVLDPTEKDETVLVGDSRLNDVKGAQNAGIGSILVKGRSTEDFGPKATWEVERLQEILEIIEI
ncbi:hypothetical protein AKJ43_00680 [candidate division MSBL1 archaeon SCGC-AAA261D19]|uniref:Haloacid dehalogenase n=1 Tax=candidate division MSBL1 archaeon SCGC-AAA261D19 TaxID=1698273 RepID=A0A133V8E1_9EURY|nr:hypothetical protein AKJ43_00680 [candidate division MSBL1 archaeon SCGC-AAA261D19]